MPVSRRLLTQHDAAASRQLGQEAFGFSGEPSPPILEPYPPAGSHAHAAFDDGQLVAKIIAREYRSHFAGTQIPTCGIAGVTVQAEYRGRGLLTELFADSFAAARQRGEVISTLFPTAPRIYRKFGYELVGDYVTVEIPSSALVNIGVPQGMSTRRATTDDVEQIHRVYTAWAAGQHGPLTRTGPCFAATAEEFIGEFTGVTLAIDHGGAVTGFVSWDRGPGYDRAATLAISDLIGLTPAAAQALWSVAGSFASVTGQVRVDTSGDDIARLVLPGIGWKIVASSPYMLAVIEVAAAFSLRTAPPGLSAVLDFTVAGHPIASENGEYRLEIDGGTVVCSSSADSRCSDAGSGSSDDGGRRTLSPHGLALTFAGTQSAGNLRLAGQLTGGAAEQDPLWDAVFGGRQFHIRDYF